MEIYVNRSEHSVQLKKEQKTLIRKGAKKVKDRRKAALDRRYSVNEGLMVRLSTRKDRRSENERRASAHHHSLIEQNQTDSSPGNIFFSAVV